MGKSYTNSSQLWVGLLIFLGFRAALPAQSAPYPIDSSYTVAGSYQKVIKNYPNIQIAEPVPETYIRSNLLVFPPLV